MVLKKAVSTVLAATMAFLVFVGCGQAAPFASSETNEINQTTSLQGYPEDKSAEIVEAAYPESYIIETENHFDYQPGLECSAFATAYVLRHFGEEADGMELFKDFPGKLPGGAGVTPSGVKQFWNDRDGYTAEFKIGGTIDELKCFVSTGVPVIVFVHVEEPYESTHNTHYLPLVGYDADYFYFAESLDSLANCKEESNLSYNRKTEISKFERLWTNIDGTWNNPYFIITQAP